MKDLGGMCRCDAVTVMHCSTAVPPCSHGRGLSWAITAFRPRRQDAPPARVQLVQRGRGMLTACSATLRCSRVDHLQTTDNTRMHISGQQAAHAHPMHQRAHSV